MASFIDVSGLTYCGQEAQTIFSRDIYDIDLRQYGVTFLDGVKGKMKIYNGELGDVWQPYTCPFSPSGSVVLAESFIEPVALKVNLEECYDKFWNTFLVEQTSITLNGGIPQTFSEWFFDKLRKKMAKEYQEIAWQGDTASTASTAYIKVTDGWEKQLHSNSAVTKVSGASFTVDNAISQVEAVILSGMAVAGEAGVDTEGYKVFMNHSDLRVLEVALGKVCCESNLNNRIFGNYGRENGRIYVMGYEIVPTMQTKGKVIFGPASNLVLGFDTYDSHIEYKLIDMRNTTGDNMFRILALTNIAVGIVLPELFVLSE